MNIIDIPLGRLKEILASDIPLTIVTTEALITRLEQAEQAVARVREVHKLEFRNKWGRECKEPDGNGGWCKECGNFQDEACPTIRALDGEQA